MLAQATLAIITRGNASIYKDCNAYLNASVPWENRTQVQVSADVVNTNTLARSFLPNFFIAQIFWFIFGEWNLTEIIFTELFSLTWILADYIRWYIMSWIDNTETRRCLLTRIAIIIQFCFATIFLYRRQELCLHIPLRVSWIRVSCWMHGCDTLLNVLSWLNKDIC